MSDYNLFPSDICSAIKDLLTFPVIRVMQDNKQVDVPAVYVYPELEDNHSAPVLTFFDQSATPDLGRMQVGVVLKDNETYDDGGNLLSVDLRDHPASFYVDVYIRLKFKFYEHRDTVRKEIYRRFQVPRGSILVNDIPLLIHLEKEIPMLDDVDERGNKVAQWLFSVSTYFDVNPRTKVSTVQEINLDVKSVD